jgi:wyosine [tRNA(Phe)-imidazoG37] synthetase (radical SAM superfamily)
MGYIQLQSGIVYGPVGSKRLGKSLGINILPSDRKVCVFNCVYCHYGPTCVGEYKLPTPDEVESALKERLRKKEKIDYITFAGNGEPTLHPQFLEITERVKELRNRLAPGVPIALLSNSTFLGHGDVAAALTNIDLPIFKLDAGESETFNAINRPIHVIEIEPIIRNLASIKKVTIQTVFLDGRLKNYCGYPFQKWLDAMMKISPKEVQIYSPDEPIPQENIVPLELEKLREIAREASRTLTVKVMAY